MSYIEVASGVGVEFKPDAEPTILWEHIDGPMLCLRNGQVHWLTLWERLRCWLGYDNAYTLERKLAPEFVERWVAHANRQFVRNRI